MSGHLYLIDGSGFIFRAFFALPALSRQIDNLPTGAVSGFCNMLWNLQSRLAGEFEATHLAVVFDAGRRTFRHDIDPAYKSNRKETPADLAPQFPLIREAARYFNVASVEMPGFEADDLIATYARIARDAGMRTTIVSSDKDLMQLCMGGVDMYDPIKSRRISDDDIRVRFGVGADKVRFVQALAGDSVDNVPGARGIGPKIAGELIAKFGDVETLLARVAEIPQPKRRETIIACADDIRRSLRLVTLDDRATIPAPLDALAVDSPAPSTLIPWLKAMEFDALAQRIAQHFRLPFDELPPASIAIGDEFAWYRDAVAGKSPQITANQPQSGFFRRKLIKDGPYVPARIWIDRTTRAILCEVDGQPADPLDQWTFLAGRPVSEADFRFMVAHAAWARQHSPTSPNANPDQPIDPITSPLPF